MLLRRRIFAALPLTLVVAIACSKAGEAPAPAPPSPASSSLAPTSTSPAPSSGRASDTTTPSSTGARTEVPAETSRPTDSFQTTDGELRVLPIHHATVLFTWKGHNVYADPFHEGNLAGLPKADVILITHDHPDHFDPVALGLLKQTSTIVVAPASVAEKLSKDFTQVIVLKNGDTQTVLGVGVEAVPMYNLTRGPSAGKLFHPKGNGDGYVLTFGDKRVYLSGDTECTPEMKALKNIDVAFVCMNLPYTMPPAEAAACVEAFRPKVVYPYHYRNSNLKEFEGPLAADHGIEVRERAWY